MDSLSLENIRSDFLQPVGSRKLGKTGRYWTLFLLLVALWGAIAYTYQLSHGLEATAMRNYVSWGLYISTFVFLSGISMSGTLVSAVLRITNQEWRRPITRSAELLTVVALLFCGLMPIVDMGRPDRILHLVLFGRMQSPLVWDVLCIGTYLIGSTLFLYLPMIPDIALCRDRLRNKVSSFRSWIYNKLSLGWNGTPAQWQRLSLSMRIMTIIILPIAVSVHTVVSFIFALTLRPGWNSTIFGPYFIAGALYSGAACVILTMAVFRKVYHLEQYITPRHFDLMGKIVLALTLIYAYFNLNEYWVPAYKMETHEGFLLTDLFKGSYSLVFWMVQFGSVLIPAVIFSFPKGRSPLITTVVAAVIVIGSWIKRYLIVIPTLLHPFLPVQGVSEKWAHYFPNWVEWSVTLGALAGIFLVITVFSKIFPISSIWEVEEGVQIEHDRKMLVEIKNQEAREQVVSVRNCY